MSIWKITLAATVLLVLAGTQGALGQGGYYLPQAPAGYGSPRPAPAQATGEVTIKNVSNQKLVFYLKATGSSKCSRYELYPHQDRSFQSRMKSGGLFLIKVATKDREYVQYSLKPFGQYTLKWDKHKSVWDVKTDT